MPSRSHMASRPTATAHTLLAQLIERGTPSLEVLALYLGASTAEVSRWSAQRESLPLPLQDRVLRVALAFVPTLVRPARIRRPRAARHAVAARGARWG